MYRWVIAALLWAGAALASPVEYRLNSKGSKVEFNFDVGGTVITGRVPVVAASLRVDFDDLPASAVDVQLDIASASTGLALATSAMKSDDVLAAAQFPTARFVSRRIDPVGAGARISGDLTLRGVTRTVVLDGQIFRTRGSDPGDLRVLVLLFEGAVDRRDFGATGYAQLVKDRVTLRVLVEIERID